MKNCVLVVDDMEINRELLQEILEKDYEVLQAAGGKEAIDTLSQRHEETALVLLDLIMPEMDGFQVLDAMKEKGWLGRIPVIIISGESSSEAEVKCFEYGVSDFIQKPFAEKIVQKRVSNIVHLFTYQDSLEACVEKQTVTIREQNRTLNEQAEALREMNNRIIDMLGNVVEFRNLESGEHVKRVKGFTRILGYQLMEDFPQYGLTPEKVEQISDASSLHDIGKIVIPDNILLKPGRLTDEEFEIMKSHTTRGCEILDSIDDIWEEEEYRKISYDICRHHHERHDGRGYPDHLKEEEIPLPARIVSVADVYDALVSERVYKSAFSLEEAFDMIVTGKCGMFAPDLLYSFRNAREKFEELTGRKKA